MTRAVDEQADRGILAVMRSAKTCNLMRRQCLYSLKFREIKGFHIELGLS